MGDGSLKLQGAASVDDARERLQPSPLDNCYTVDYMYSDHTHQVRLDKSHRRGSQNFLLLESAVITAEEESERLSRR